MNTIAKEITSCYYGMLFYLLLESVYYEKI
jgi:hypothetical protein